MKNIIQIIQLRPVYCANMLIYEAYNYSTGCKIPVMGQSQLVIQQRVRKLFPEGELLRFEVCQDVQHVK